MIYGITLFFDEGFRLKVFLFFINLINSVILTVSEVYLITQNIRYG
jgi:hypothetical protein